jgi:predicted DCC family thiol-disulfide oxidoreductase YuxK
MTVSNDQPMPSPSANDQLAGKTGDVWFVYDGDCPICSVAARGLRIRKAVGSLNLVDARAETDHPILQEVRDRKLDLDQGMVIKFGDICYHGADALQVMALLGTGQGWFNRMNALLFRSKTLSQICYPPMRATRNLLIRLRGVDKIDNLGKMG